MKDATEKKNEVKVNGNNEGIKPGKKQRSARKDRSDGKYSEEAFRNLSREVQFELAKEYWNKPVNEFDDGTFQFSSSHFAEVCKSLQFEKRTVVVDAKAEEKENQPKDTVVVIDHGRRETERHNWTFSEGTNDKIERLLGENLSNMEKSKVIDVILNNELDNLLKEKEAGRFHVDYRPVEKVRLV